MPVQSRSVAISVPSAPPVLPAKQLVASLWMVGASMSFVALALATRQLTYDFSIAQIMFFRVGPALPILVGAVWLTQGRAGFGSFRTGSLKLHFLRNLFQMSGQAGWVFAIGTLPFAMVFAIEYSTPLWSVLISGLVLREHPNRWQKIGLLMGFAGVLIIVRPGPEGISWGALLMILGCVAFACNHSITRILRRTDAPMTNPFWTCVLQSPVTFVLAVAIGWTTIEWHHVPAILVLACASLSAHFCAATALGMAPIARVMPIDYLRLPVIAAIGVIFYAEPIEAMALMGAAIVIAGVLLTQRTGRAA